jgi:hypothetical protein
MSGFDPGRQVGNPNQAAKKMPSADCFYAEAQRLLAQAELDRPGLWGQIREGEGTGLPGFLNAFFAHRNDVIRFSLHLGLGIAQTQKLLLLSENRPLDLKVLRDAAIAFCLKQHFSVSQSSVFLQRRNVSGI